MKPDAICYKVHHSLNDCKFPRPCGYKVSPNYHPNHHHYAWLLVCGLCGHSLCLVFAEYGAVHDSQTSLPWFCQFKGYCSRKLVVFSHAILCCYALFGEKGLFHTRPPLKAMRVHFMRRNSICLQRSVDRIQGSDLGLNLLGCPILRRLVTILKPLYL